MKRIGIVATQVAMLRALEVKTQVLLKEPDFDVQLETLQLAKAPTPRIELGDLKIELFNAAERLFERGYGVVGFADETVPSFFPELATECRARLVNPKDLSASTYAADLIDALKDGPVLKGFKVGMIGGLGPAATVDLYDKITKATPAKNDQEHIRVVIEQNPQIPDRTKCLLDNGEDPTLALYNCAKRLEKDGCDALIIPCNTAHAFAPYMERHLSIPFINMQKACMDEIEAKFGEKARVGLLATTGTVKTGIYSKKAEAMGIAMFVPDAEHQERVMAAIYGPKGAKAGFTDGVCRDDLVSAAEYMVKTYDCNVLILGCTELPLILDEGDMEVAGKTVFVIDPTSALARRVVKTALEANKERGF